MSATTKAGACALVIAFCLRSSSSIWGSLDPRSELIEIMMEAEGNTGEYIGFNFGADNAATVLFTTFTNNTARSFSFASNPSQTYLGMPLTITGSGAYNAADSKWQWTTSSQLGATAWTSAGEETVVGDPVGDFSEAFGKSGQKLVGTETYDDPGDLSILRSTRSGVVKNAQGTVIGNFSGTDFYNYFSKRYEWKSGPNITQAAAYNVKNDGMSDYLAGGAGSYSMTITVPEPSGFVSMLAAVAVLTRRPTASNGVKQYRA
jgi:hypothetical protein